MALCLAPCTASGQTPIAPAASVVRSHSSGFFVGLGYEGDASQVNEAGSPMESGSGGGLVLGYGFSPKWSLYGEGSGATMLTSGGDTYSLAHVDLGVRRHFRTGPNVVVPFIQFGLSARGVSQSFNGNAVTGSGGGLSAGVGLNAHFTPSFAFSAAATWDFGQFNNFEVNNTVVNADAVSVMTTRVHVGVIWFPGA
jgi:hypothetical protein